jgi:hypothetical protein
VENNAWVNLLGAIFASGFFTAIGTSLSQKWSGRAEARRLRNREIAEAEAARRATVDLAEAREDWERRFRQEMESYAAACRIACISHGGTPPDPPNILKILGPRP